MTHGSQAKRARPYVTRKPDSYIATWLPRVESYIKDMDDQCFQRGEPRAEFFRVDTISDWLTERYVPFRDFKPLFKKIVVGKCLKSLGHERFMFREHGWTYRRVT